MVRYLDDFYSSEKERFPSIAYKGRLGRDNASLSRHLALEKEEHHHAEAYSLPGAALLDVPYLTAG